MSCALSDVHATIPPEKSCGRCAPEICIFLDLGKARTGTDPKSQTQQGFSVSKMPSTGGYRSRLQYFSEKLRCLVVTTYFEHVRNIPPLPAEQIFELPAVLDSSELLDGRRDMYNHLYAWLKNGVSWVS